MKKVESIQEAINGGYNYVVAFRDHYRGNSKGEIYTNLSCHSDVCMSHYNMDDRGIHTMYATNQDLIAMVNLRSRIIRLINQVEHSMSMYSRLWSGTRREYNGSKMVFGTWRTMYKAVTYPGCSNFDKTTFFTRHSKILAGLKNKLRATDSVSSTMAIIN